jgi:hypothetical protein
MEHADMMTYSHAEDIAAYFTVTVKRADERGAVI